MSTLNGVYRQWGRVALFFLLLFGGFVLSQQAVQAETCCLVQTDSYVTVETLGSRQVSMSGVNSTSTCFRITTETLCDEGAFAPTCEEQPDYDDSLAATVNNCKKITRRTVNCSRYPVLCQVDRTAENDDCDALVANSSAEDQFADCNQSTNCFFAGGRCLSRFDSSICSILPKPFCGTPEGAKSSHCTWNADTNRCLPAIENALGSQYGKSGIDDLLPTCAIQGNCRNLNDIIIVFIRIVRYVFGIIGSLAFAAFIYGGFMMIISFGNSEKIDKGKSALVAAIIGLAIAFSAYVLIGYVLDIFTLPTDLRAIGSGS